MTSRIASMRISLLVACGILTLRLVQLQLLHGNDYLQLAEHNRLRLVPAPAPRGLIVDRQGRVLAANETVFRVAVVPQELDDLHTVLARVSVVAKRPLDALQKEYGRPNPQDPGQSGVAELTLDHAEAVAGYAPRLYLLPVKTAKPRLIWCFGHGRDYIHGC